MKLFPRLRYAKIRRLSRNFRAWRRNLSIGRVTFYLELLILIGALLFLLTGRRAEVIDEFGRRADFVVLALALALFGMVHLMASRRIVPFIERRFLPAAYDDRRIIFDLGQEARAATNIEQLYELIVERIGGALETENVSIFVRDDETGKYVCRVSSEPLEGGAEVPALSGEAFVVKRLRHLKIPMDIGPEDFATWRRAFDFAAASVRAARELECQTLEQIKSRLLLQIMIKEQLVGILSLGPRRAAHPYSPEDKEMLMSVASQLAFVIENSKLVERMVAEAQLRRELAWASEVQQRLFPTAPPSSDRVEMAGFCQPALGIGGDYYDFLSFDNRQLGIAIADVSGKGISAALLMSTVQASLRSQSLAHNARGAGGSLCELVSTMNRLLCRSTQAANYATFFYGQFDEDTDTLTYVNAGHNPPFLIRPADQGMALQKLQSGGELRQMAAAVSAADGASPGEAPARMSDAAGGAVASLAAKGRSVKLSTGGPIIGMFEHCQYEQEQVQMYPGDLLAAYTDGVSEAINAAGEEYGEERLQQFLAERTHLSADELCEEVVSHLQVWCAGVPQHDDMTFVALKVR